MKQDRWQELSDKLADALESDNPREFAGDDKELGRLIDAYFRSESWLEPPPRDAMLGRRILDRYQLERVLGRGGTGVVYIASDARIGDRLVVVKLLHDFWNSEEWMRRKFREEALALSKLDHPGIIALLDAGETEDGRLFLLMPYHAGRTLRQVLDAGRVDTLSAAKWIREAGEAIGHAHDRGILHRDLKPENILLVSRDGAQESPMLLDFGIAQLSVKESSARTTTHLMGSAYYMAPEHLLGRPEPASDLFSLATIVWEVLAGEHPFPADSPFALPELHRRGVGDAFYRLRPDLGLDVGRMLTRGLDVDPKRRPMPVNRFASDLADAIAATGLDLRFARLWAVRSSRRWIIGSGAVALAGATGAGWFLHDRWAPLDPRDCVVTYSGGLPPSENGFREKFDLYSEFVTEQGRRDYRSVRFFSKGQGLSVHPLTAAQKRAAFRRGWRLRLTATPETGSVGVLLDCGTYAPRFDMSLEKTPTGVEAIAATQVRAGTAGPSAQVDATNGQAIDLEMEYVPTTRSATVRAGGKVITTGYLGHQEYRQDEGVTLFVETRGIAEARAIIFGARFEIVA